MLVQLKYATLPIPLGAFAVHYWFTVLDPASGKCDRWEVWQSRDAGGESVGHLHCNLKAPHDGVGGGPARVDAEWRGDEASRILAVLKDVNQTYPFSHHYVPWPGPNSNTFVAWVLRQARISFPLNWRALGQDFA